MRLAFFGTPPFSCPALQALLDAGHDIAAVYTPPPRPAARGQKLRKSAVHDLAEQCGLLVHTPASLKDPTVQQQFAELKLDAAVVVAYGLILPPAILDAPRLGCLNIHASLLPRWRGAAPIERALLAGDQETGVTIMLMDEGLDTGPELLKESLPIDATTTATQLHDALSAMGARLIVDALTGYAAGTITPTPQATDGATYASKLSRDEAQLDWRNAAIELDRKIRALNPRPGTWCTIDDNKVHIRQAHPGPSGESPDVSSGTIIATNPLTIMCGDGTLIVDAMQRQGRKTLPTHEYLRGHPLSDGARLT